MAKKKELKKDIIKMEISYKNGHIKEPAKEYCENKNLEYKDTIKADISIYTDLFHQSLFDLPPSLFVAGTNLCIKKMDESFIECACKHPLSPHTKAHKCSNCGNPILGIDENLCLMAPLKEIHTNCFFQVLYFFNVYPHCSKNTLVLERILEITFDVWKHQVLYKELTNTQLIQSLDINMLEQSFYEQSNTFKSMQKGLMPLTREDFGGVWSFGRSRKHKKILLTFPYPLEMALEFVLLTYKDRFFQYASPNIPILMTYYAYLFYQKHRYLHTLPVPLLHSTRYDFYQGYEQFTTLDSFIDEGLFNKKATKAIKKWFYNELEIYASNNELFTVDMILVLTPLFQEPKNLLKALMKSKQIEKSLYENVLLGAELWAYLREQKGEKWLLNHMFALSFYNDDFYDLAINVSFMQKELKGFILPKVQNIEDIVDAISLFLEVKEKNNL